MRKFELFYERVDGRFGSFIIDADSLGEAVTFVLNISEIKRVVDVRFL